MKIDSIRCDFRGCPNLTNKIAKLADLPDKVLGQVIPSYEVWVKICNKHELKNVLVEELEFVTIDPHPWPGTAPFFYKCIRCGHEWKSHYFTTRNEEYGKIPNNCPNTKCNNDYWYKTKRFKRERTTGTWKETKVMGQAQDQGEQKK